MPRPSPTACWRPSAKSSAGTRSGRNRRTPTPSQADGVTCAATPTLVHGDVVALVAVDLVLRIVLAAVAGVAMPLEVAHVDLRDHAADLAGLGVPAHVVADAERNAHRRARAVAADSTACARRQTSST